MANTPGSAGEKEVLRYIRDTNRLLSSILELIQEQNRLLRDMAARLARV